MAKYQAYTEYKDSGVEWLGKIPSHWGAKPLKYLCTYNNEVISETTKKDYEIQYIDIGSVSATQGISNIETMAFADAPSRARRIVRDGDVIISTVRTYLEAIAPIDNPPDNLIVSTGFAVIRPTIKLHKGYAAYCLRAKGFIKEVVARSVGVSYPAINASELVNIQIPELDWSEQNNIANFLDHETKKIDHLIEKQQQLIELLKEKRQAVISHAVTKGLDPNVPMKDSGVEWLGKVPEHWDILKLSAIADITRLAGYEYTEYWQSDDDGEIIAIRGQNIRFNKLVNLDTAERIANKLSMRLKRSRLYKNDIAFPCVGTIGNAVLINESDKYHINQNIAKLTPNLKIHPLYLVFFLNSSICLESALFLNTSDAQPSILVGNLRKVKIAFPSINEQIEIAENINEQLKQIDGLIFESNKMISLFIERRTSLISAAVTGKIDVRNWQAPTLAEADTELSA